MDKVVWADSLEGQLKELHEKGLSFSIIADRMGLTRSAVIGKAHRMQLPARPTGSATAEKRERRKVVWKERVVAVAPPPKPVAVAPVAPVPAPDPGPPRRIPIAKLTDASCRFPLWGHWERPPREALYCGRPEAAMALGHPYCREHARLCLPPRS